MYQSKSVGTTPVQPANLAQPAKKAQQASVQEQQPVARDTMVPPAPASMSMIAPPAQSFERNGLKAPTCPGMCWPQDENCCYFNWSGGSPGPKGLRLCCIKLG